MPKHSKAYSDVWVAFIKHEMKRKQTGKSMITQLKPKKTEYSVYLYTLIQAFSPKQRFLYILSECSPTNSRNRVFVIISNNFLLNINHIQKHKHILNGLRIIICRFLDNSQGTSNVCCGEEILYVTICGVLMHYVLN